MLMIAAAALALGSQSMAWNMSSTTLKVRKMPILHHLFNTRGRVDTTTKLTCLRVCRVASAWRPRRLGRLGRCLPMGIEEMEQVATYDALGIQGDPPL
jgi:hypothetical protein